jgi:lipoprotein-anchoring transpeptidase ErfK/SrfK
MKFIKSIQELNEARQAPAKKLFKMVVDGNTSEIEGVKISKDMAQAALDWFDQSAYARKYEKQVKTAGMGAVAPLIFGDNWGIKKRIPSKLKAEFKELQAQYKRVMSESVINESDKTPTMLLADEIEGAEFHHGFGDGTEVEARSTKKTWDDGVPVLKYIARAPKKSVKTPKGKFEVVIDDKYGWIYWQDKGVWYGMDKDDDYIPFEF